MVLPTAFAVDLDGPDADGTLYLHGSVAAGWLRRRRGADRVRDRSPSSTAWSRRRSAFHHSMNYRSAVVIGDARLVDDPDERARALDLIVDHMIPGRSATLRPPTRKELAATAVLAVPLREASMKARARRPGRRAGGRRRRRLGRPHPAAPGRAAPVSSAESEGSPAPDRRGPARGGSRLTTRVRAMTQRTLVLLKPDAVRRGLVGEVLSRFEAKGLTIVAMEHRRSTASSPTGTTPSTSSGTSTRRCARS